MNYISEISALDEPKVLAAARATPKRSASQMAGDSLIQLEERRLQVEERRLQLFERQLVLQEQTLVTMQTISANLSTFVQNNVVQTVTASQYGGQLLNVGTNQYTSL